MQTERDERDRDETSRDDARWLERVRALYAPEPLDAAKRAAFDARLRERLERRRRSLPLLPALGAAALAAVLVWNARPAATPEAIPVAQLSPAAQASPADARWERSLLLGDPTRARAAGQSKELPPDYRAIEYAFFDDV
jgi:hypothetical protein